MTRGGTVLFKHGALLYAVNIDLIYLNYYASVESHDQLVLASAAHENMVWPRPARFL